MPKIAIGVNIPSLPEGWEGTPDQLIAFIEENIELIFTGAFPTGQINGTRPTEDIGIWYGDNSIEKFSNGQYRAITDVPIGAMMPWASASATPPENYLIADGRSLVRADYAELFAVIGVTWGFESSTTFNLPDGRGRTAVGAGVGDYAKQGLVGRMKELAAGAYAGLEWWARTTIFAPNAPKTAMRDTPFEYKAAAKYVDIRNPLFCANWLIRSK